MNIFYHFKQILGNGNDYNKNGNKGNDENDDAGNEGSGDSHKGRQKQEIVI